MGKVVTSGGLNEFISSGKVEEFKPDPKPKPAVAAPPLEVVKPEPVKDAGEPEKVTPPPEVTAPPEDTADDDETRAEADKSQKLKETIDRKNATINRKHREMREAQEAARDAEEFAKGQWNEKRLAEERAERLERENAELKAKAAPAAKVPEKVKPDPKSFYDDRGQFKAFEYAEELAAYSASKAVEDDRKRQAEERGKAEAAEAERVAKARIAETIKAHPDFDEVLKAADVQTHNAVLSYLSASEHIGEVSYYLATHSEFVERINKLNPLKAIAEIGKLEATFEKAKAAAPAEAEAPAPKAAAAPAPIKPLSSAASVNVNVDPSKMSYRELRAYERARQKRR